MSANVFANGRGVSAKKNINRSLAAMPDVCLSPPSPPAGPLPIPYPNFSQASDTSGGTKSVSIRGKEVGKKNSSNYKKSRGDTPATRNFGMGVVTHTLEGKTYHAAWSFDVKVEGKNVIRHLDLTTHNHASTPPNTMASTVDQADQAIAQGKELSCTELDIKNQEARSEDLKPSVQDGFTVTTASYTPPGGGPSTFHKSATPADIVRSNKSAAYAKANKKKTMACTGDEYGSGSPRHSPVENNKTRNHTEPKLMEPIFQAAGSPSSPQPLGKLTMKIFHKDAGKPADAMPCDSCKAGICAATNCGLEIKLCNKQNEPADPPCDEGKPKPEAEWVAVGLG